MAGFKSLARCNEILDGELGSGSPGNWYLGLFTDLPDVDGTGGTEVAGGGSGYARLAVPNNAANWPAANAAAKHNALDLVWPEATAAWGIVVGVGIFTAAEGGVLNRVAVMAVPKEVTLGIIFRILANTLIIREA